MGRPGFEPGTNRLKAEYSTVELATRVFGVSQTPYLNVSHNADEMNPFSKKIGKTPKTLWAMSGDRLLTGR